VAFIDYILLVDLFLGWDCYCLGWR